jgi:hypothetical protein
MLDTASDDGERGERVTRAASNFLASHIFSKACPTTYRVLLERESLSVLS